MRAGDRGRPALLATGAAHMAQDGLGAALYVLMPVLAQSFGLSYAQVGAVRAVKAAVMTLLELPSGILSERYGERRLIVFGLIAAGGGFLALSAASSIAVVVAALALTGAGAAFQHALCSALISRSVDERRRRGALGIYNSIGDGGKLLFSAAVSLGLGAGLAWQGVTAGLGALALGAGVAAYRILRRADLGGPVRVDASNPAPRRDWGLLDPTAFAALTVTVLLDTGVQSGFALFVAFLMASKGVAVHLAGFAVVLTLIGGMFGKASCGYLAQRFGLRRAFAMVQIATALGLVAVVAAPPLLAFLLLAPLGVALQGSSSITYGAVADLVRSDRHSRGFALIYAVSGLSAILVPVALGALSDVHGLDAAMLAMAAISLLAIAPSLLLRPASANRRTV